MKHIAAISRRPGTAQSTLATLLDFFVFTVQIGTAYLFQKRGGSLGW